jgi:hypothetical protein
LDGCPVGCFDGREAGCLLGCPIGCLLGSIVGCNDGWLDGWVVGIDVGILIAVVGLGVGLGVGGSGDTGDAAATVAENSSIPNKTSSSSHGILMTIMVKAVNTPISQSLFPFYLTPVDDARSGPLNVRAVQKRLADCSGSRTRYTADIAGNHRWVK